MFAAMTKILAHHIDLENLNIVLIKRFCWCGFENCDYLKYGTHVIMMYQHAQQVSPPPHSYFHPVIQNNKIVTKTKSSTL